MKTVLIAKLPETNVEVKIKSDGNRLFIGKEPLGEVFECERSYLNGVLDTLQRFTKFQVTFIDNY